jgi:hypothetical protein
MKKLILAVLLVLMLSPVLGQGGRGQFECIQYTGDTADFVNDWAIISYDTTEDALIVDFDGDCELDGFPEFVLDQTISAGSCATDAGVMYYSAGTGFSTCEANFLYNAGSNHLFLVGGSKFGVNMVIPDHELDVLGESELTADSDDVVLQVLSQSGISATEPQLRLSHNTAGGQDCSFLVNASRVMDIDCGGSGGVTFNDPVTGVACTGAEYVQYGTGGGGLDCTVALTYDASEYEIHMLNAESDRSLRFYADDAAAVVPTNSMLIVAEDTDTNQSIDELIIAADNGIVYQSCCTGGSECRYPVDACPAAGDDRITMVAGEFYVCTQAGVCSIFEPNLTLNSGSPASSTAFTFNGITSRTTGLMAEFQDATTTMWSLDTSPMTQTFGDGTAEDICYTFDLDTDQNICWDESAGGGDGFSLSDSIVQIDGGAQDNAFLEVRNAVYSNPLGQLDWIESSNTFHVYAMDILEIGTEDPDVASSSDNPYIQVSRLSDQIAFVGASVVTAADSTSFVVSDQDALTVGTGGQGTGALTKQLTRITSGSDGNDVTNQTNADGRFWIVANESGADLDYYPLSGGNVNNAGTNTAITLGGNNMALCANVGGGVETYCGQMGLDTEPPKKTFLFSSFVPKNQQNLDEQMWGGLVQLVDGDNLDSGNSISVTNGVSKLLVDLRACSDSAGSITVTGDSYNRDTGAVSAADTDTLTISGTTTDNSSQDANSNDIHEWSNIYITSKWMTDAVLTTADITCTEVDVWGVMFEQANDNDNATLATIDISAIPTNTNAWFYTYVYLLTVSGDTASIVEQVNAASCQPLEVTTAESEANVPYRLRCVMDADFDGTSDGFWVEMHPGPNALAYWTNISTKLWVEADQ